jgi:hypothetical protein
MWLIVASCAVGVAGIKSSSLAMGLACRVASRHSCQPYWIGLGAEASHCGSRLARILSHSWDSGRLLLLLSSLDMAQRSGGRMEASVVVAGCSTGLSVLVVVEETRSVSTPAVV